MPKKNKYALIAKDNNSNNYKFISFDDEKITKLEKIDLYTMHFDNKDEFVKKLIENGQIDNSDVDIFIVCSKKDGKEITFMEPIYFGPNYYLSKDLVDIIPQFLKKNVDNKKCFDNILKQFENRILNSPGFYDMVVWNRTNLYGKFTDYIRQSKRVSGFMEKIKYNDGGWIYDSYPLIRNIVEAINRHDEVAKLTQDVFYKNSEIAFDKKKKRESIIPSLHDKFKTGYIVGQISMFDMFGSNNNVEIVEAPKVAEIKEPPKETKISRINWKEECALCADIDIDEKLSVVRSVLWELPRNVFINRRLNDGREFKVFNENIFQYYEDEKSRKILKNALSSSLMNLINMSSIKKEDYELAMSNYSSTGYIQEDMRFFRNCVMKELKKDKNNYEILNRAYIWCNTYIDCRDKDMEYRNRTSKGFSK